MYAARKWHHTNILAMLAIKARLKRSAGFTLIELMITVAIAAILMMVAAPNISAYRRNAELTSAANTFMASLNTARSEAMKRGRNAMVVPINNGANWNAGWVVFVDIDRSQDYNESTDSVVASQAALQAGITITGVNSASGGTPYVMFDASGYSRLKAGGFGALTLSIARLEGTAAEQLDQTRRIIIASTGRVRMCKPLSATDSNCSSGISNATGQ